MCLFTVYNPWSHWYIVGVVLVKVNIHKARGTIMHDIKELAEILERSTFDGELPCRESSMQVADDHRCFMFQHGQLPFRRVHVISVLAVLIQVPDTVDLAN